MIEERIFYKRNLEGEVIAIKYGETGYYLTDMDNDEHIAFANRVFDNTQNEIYAAETCSMFDCWDRFDEIVEKLDSIDKLMKIDLETEH
jgi:hypothetical protein